VLNEMNPPNESEKRPRDSEVETSQNSSSSSRNGRKKTPPKRLFVGSDDEEMSTNGTTSEDLPSLQNKPEESKWMFHLTIIKNKSRDRKREMNFLSRRFVDLTSVFEALKNENEYMYEKCVNNFWINK